jgi:hypothetical protein
VLHMGAPNDRIPALEPRGGSLLAVLKWAATNTGPSPRVCSDYGGRQHFAEALLYGFRNDRLRGKSTPSTPTDMC